MSNHKLCEHKCGECEYLIVRGKRSGYCYHNDLMPYYPEMYERLRKKWLKRTFGQKTTCSNFKQRKSSLEILRGGTIMERWYVATQLDILPRKKYSKLENRRTLLSKIDRAEFGNEL